MAKKEQLNMSMITHVDKIESAIKLADIVADDFTGVECDAKTLERLENLAYELVTLKTKLSRNANLCCVCGQPVYTASPHVAEKDGKRWHLECWCKQEG